MESSDLLVIPGGALAVKAETPDTLTVGGLLVIFDEPGTTSRDLSGEYFTAKTYLGPAASKSDPFEIEATFNHGIAPDPRLAPLCEHEYAPLKVQRTDAGIMAELVLNLRDDYEAMLADLARKGKLGWSSGSAKHRTRIDKGGEIKHWTLVEGAITPTPCEPRTSAVPVKAVSLAEYAAKALEGGTLSYEERIGRVQTAVAGLYPDGRDAWAHPVETYDDHAIVRIYERGNERYERIPYTVDDAGAAVLAPSSDWQAVERRVTYEDAAAKSMLDIITADEDARAVLGLL